MGIIHLPMDQWIGPRVDKKKKKGPNAQRPYNKTLNILPKSLDPEEILWPKVSFHMDKREIYIYIYIYIYILYLNIFNINMKLLLFHYML